MKGSVIMNKDKIELKTETAPKHIEGLTPYKLKYALKGFFIEPAESKEEAEKQVKEHILQCLAKMEEILDTKLTLREEMDVLEAPDNDYDVHFVIDGFMYLRVPNEESAMLTGDHYIQDRVDQLERILGTALEDMDYVYEVELDTEAK